MIRYSTKGRKQYRKTDAFDLSEDSLCLGKFVEGLSPYPKCKRRYRKQYRGHPPK